MNFNFQQDVGDDDEGVDCLLDGIRRAGAHGGVYTDFPMVSAIRIAGDFGRLSLAKGIAALFFGT